MRCAYTFPVDDTSERRQGALGCGPYPDVETPHAMTKHTLGRDDSTTTLGDSAPREQERCSVCHRRLGNDIAYLDETGDVPEPRQSWMLCPTCNAAVRAEMERSPVQGPLRVRIAVGLVAAERSPDAVRRIRTGLRDDAWLPLLFWGFGIVMLLHLIVIALVALQH